VSSRHHERGWRAEQPAPRGPHGAPGRPGALNAPGASCAKSRHHIWAMGSPCHHPVITSPSPHSIRRLHRAGRAGQTRLTHTDPQDGDGMPCQTDEAFIVISPTTTSSTTRQAVPRLDPMQHRDSRRGLPFFYVCTNSVTRDQVCRACFWAHRVGSRSQP
jgi:hypothetical protein